MVPHGEKRQSSSGQGLVATHRWQPWRAVWAERTRPPNSSSCMRKAGTTTQRASPWPKSACMGHSELCTCRRVEGPGLSPQDDGPTEGLLDMPKRRVTPSFRSSPLQNRLFFDRELTPLGLKAWLLLPHRKSCPHLGVLPFHSAGSGPLHFLPSWDNDWSFPWAGLGGPVELNKCELEIGES